MKIQKDKVVSIDYRLTNDAGKTLDSSEGKAPLAYLHGNGNIVQGLEEALDGKATGESLRVSIAPEKGYGVRDDSKVVQVPREQFGGVKDIQPGMQFQAKTPQGMILFSVVEVSEQSVKVDGNHPLAGVTLNFDVTVRDVRDATAEEVAHGHVHGPGGHSH